MSARRWIILAIFILVIAAALYEPDQTAAYCAKAHAAGTICP